MKKSIELIDEWACCGTPSSSAGSAARRRRSPWSPGGAGVPAKNGRARCRDRAAPPSPASTSGLVNPLLDESLVAATATRRTRSVLRLTRAGERKLSA
jgi:hypothetical protein